MRSSMISRPETIAGTTGKPRTVTSLPPGSVYLLVYVSVSVFRGRNS